MSAAGSIGSSSSGSGGGGSLVHAESPSALASAVMPAGRSVPVSDPCASSAARSVSTASSSGKSKPSSAAASGGGGSALPPMSPQPSSRVGSFCVFLSVGGGGSLTATNSPTAVVRRAQRREGQTA